MFEKLIQRPVRERQPRERELHRGSVAEHQLRRNVQIAINPFVHLQGE